MNGFDLVVISILALSVLLGLMRGAVKEILSLVAWVLAFLLAKQFATAAAVFIPDFIGHPILRYLGGFFLVFVLILALAMLTGLLLTEMLKAFGLSVVDRVLGGVFGLLRGLAIATVLVLLAGLTQLPKTETWRHALLSGVFESLAVMVQSWLPAELASHIHYR